MNGRYLLDTNVVIAFLTADPTLRRPDPSSQLYIPSTVIGELFYGALNSNKIDDNIQCLLDFVRDALSVPCDAETARCYGDLKTFLRRKGRPIPDNDIWVAASAIKHTLTLVTQDEHFANIDRLHVMRW